MENTVYVVGKKIGFYNDVEVEEGVIMKNQMKIIFSNIKFLSSLLVLSIVFVLVLSVINAAELNTILAKETQKYIDDVSLQVAELVDHRTYKISEGLASVADSIVYNKPDNLEEYLNRKEMLLNFQEIIVFDQFGKEITQQQTTRDFSNLSAIEHSLNGENYVYAIGEDSILYTVPIYQQNKVIGVLAGIKTKEKMQDLIQSNSFDGKCTIGIMDNEGNQIIISAQEEVFENKEKFVKEVLDISPKNWKIKVQNDLEENKHGNISFALKDNKQYVMNYYPISEYSWFLFTIIPSDIISSEINPFINRIVIVTIATILLLVLILCIFILIQFKNQKDLERSQNRYRMAIESNGDTDILWEYDNITKEFVSLNKEVKCDLQTVIAFDYDLEKDKIKFSKSFQEKFNRNEYLWQAQENIKNSDIIYSEDKETIKQIIKKCSHENSNVKGNIRLMVSKNNFEWFEIHAHTLWDEEKNKSVGIVGKMINIHHLKNEADLWKEKANCDPLTGLLNRAAFEKIVNDMIQEQRELGALIFVDIDDFKWINDHLGHSVGDDVLKYIAKHLKHIFEKNCKIGRFGGDEFVVFFPDSFSKEKIIEKLEYFKEVFQTEYQKNTIHYKISGSIGVAIYNQDANDYKGLIECADTALYYAKNHGKNQYAFYEEIL